MNSALSGRLSMAAVLLGMAASPSHAALTAYTSLASFSALTLSSATDSFTGFSIVQSTSSPMTRTAGSYSYLATASGGFYGAGSSSNPALSTNAATDAMTLSAFTGSVSAIGGLFYGTDINGAYTSAGSITILATDSTGASLSQTFSTTTISNFAGFVSTGSITSLIISEASPGSTVFPTLDNLVLAQAVPEPTTYAMLGLGLLGVALATGRNRSTTRA